MFAGKPGAYPSGAPFLAWSQELLASPTNIRLVWNGLPGINTFEDIKIVLLQNCLLMTLDSSTKVFGVGNLILVCRVKCVLARKLSILFNWKIRSMCKRPQIKFYFIFRFKFEVELDLKQPLKDLGISDMFEPHVANFGRIADDNRLHVTRDQML
jgi:hypothetical protein